MIEVLVAAAVVALLAALLIPALAQVRRAARSAQCQSNLRQLALGFRLYADTHRERFPEDDGDVPWFMQIAPLMELQVGVFRCPDDPDDEQVSYDWRDDAALLPAATLSGRKIDWGAKKDVVLVFDKTLGWHGPGTINVATVGGSATSMDEQEFETNLLLDVATGTFAR